MRRAIYILFIVLAVAGTGCGSKKSGGGSTGDVGVNPGGGGTGGVPPITDPDPSLNPDVGGATATLTLSSKSALDQYVGWTTNSPSEFKVVVNLKKYATFAKSGGGFDYGFGGYVTIQFKDGSANYSDVFSSMWNGGYPYYNTVRSNEENHKYNLLSSDYPGQNGAMAYHGFFEDARVPRLVPPMYGAPIFGGAVVLVIDSMNDLGDGQGPTSANGSVWFKNYFAQYPMGPLPYTSCWFITAGPYDCRAWPSSNGVNTKAALNPNNGYVRLGRFTNLNLKAAFNNGI